MSNHAEPAQLTDPAISPPPSATRAGGAAIFVAVTTASLAALPPPLLGSLAVVIRKEFSFDATELGLAIALFFSVSTAMSIPAGFFTERVGPRQALLLGTVLTVTGLCGIAALSPSWTWVLPWMAVCGLGNTVTQVAGNDLLARRVPAGRQGIAYGVKQSSITLAGILAGAALPLLGLTVGWRVTVAAAALVAVPVGVVAAKAGRASRPGIAPTSAKSRPWGLALVAIGAGFGAASGNALATFSVPSAVHAGLSEASAGLVLTAGATCGVLSRIAGGWFADRLQVQSLTIAAILTALGVAGFAGLATGQSGWLLPLSSAIAFAGGWAFPGLILLAVARTSRGSPARAMGAVRTGPAAGAIVGPLAFGTVVDAVGYETAWAASAGAALAAVVCFYLASVWFRSQKASPLT